MKKVASSATYSQFRKKNLTKQSHCNDISDLLQIDQLSKQLETISIKSKKANIQSKFNKPNNVIQEVDQQEFSYATQSRTTKGSETKLVKILGAKDNKFVNQNKKKLSESSKINKSLDNSISAKYLKQGIVNQKQKAHISGRASFKNKQSLPSNRRMSLTGGLTAPKKQIFSQTATSTDKDNQYAGKIQVGEALGKLQMIREKIKTRRIADNKMGQLNEKLDSILDVLNHND